MPEFKLVARGFRGTILLIPGWATDYRIFADLDIGFNYLLPLKFSPFDFEEGLQKAMEEYKLKKISMLGWSMGGFIASEFASRHRDSVDEIIFVSVRQKYDPAEIKDIKAYLGKNCRGFLYKFYDGCFSEFERDRFGWFKKKLLKDYINQMSVPILLEGLDYLSGRQFDTGGLRGQKVKFIH
ncbi:MAG: alpha/beta fold hydrolase, partial [Candidatus Omnitrophota bacterium]|nr:alpha/beta fold hydrolase [Candidatus Omnitrophota bacterium]